MALALNEPAAKIRAQLLRKMIQPAGPPPPREGDEAAIIALAAAQRAADRGA